MKALTDGMTSNKELKSLTAYATQTDSLMTSVEKALYQTQNRSSQDPLNFPVRLNDKLANIMGHNADGDFPPTQQSLDVRNHLFNLTDTELNKWKDIKATRLPRLNQMVREMQVDVIRIKRE